MTNKLLIFIALAVVVVSACSNKPGGASTIENAPQAKIKFEDVTKRSGIKFLHVPTRSEKKLMPEVIGSGVALADINRDGAPDVILVNSGVVGGVRPENARTRLYINNGKGNFTDRTDEWKLSSVGYGMGVTVGDFDNDGWPDVFLTSFDGNNRLLKNSGKDFEDVTERSGIAADGKWATSAGFFDLENDGDLDLFVARYVNFPTENPPNSYHNKLLIYPTPILFSAVSDQLWINDGSGKFADGSHSAGIDKKPMKGLAMAIGDIDADGDTDIYVANDTSPNQLWINDGKGTLKDVAQISGSAYSEVGREQANMGADFSDFDGNGLLDIADTTFQTEATAMYRQREPMLFEDVSDVVGVGTSSRARLKFGIDFFDSDNDGDEDLMVANGHIEDNIEQNSDSVTFAQQNSLYENLGGKFADISNGAGNALLDKQVSRGLATGDLDGDGALDFVVTNNGGTAQIGFNTSAEKGNFVVLWLDGDKANRSAIGTRVVARIGDKMIERQVMGSQSFLSVSDFRIHFGLASAAKIDELTIFWPGGTQQTIKDLAGGKFYYVRQGKETITFIPGEKQIQ
ncbi:MAG: CRTAC1 family protein [Pyrinomonadaceae bacterium]